MQCPTHSIGRMSSITVALSPTWKDATCGYCTSCILFPICNNITHTCDKPALTSPLSSVNLQYHEDEGDLAPYGALHKRGVTRSHRHSACWPSLTTSKTLPSFTHLAKIIHNSLFGNTLSVTLTRFKTLRSFFQNC